MRKTVRKTVAMFLAAAFAACALLPSGARASAGAWESRFAAKTRPAVLSPHLDTGSAAKAAAKKPAVKKAAAKKTVAKSAAK